MINGLKNYINALRNNRRSEARKRKLQAETPPEFVAHLQKQVNCPHAWYGSSYGGFYINPELLNEKSIVYSFGIGKDITFDLKCISKHGCRVFGFDPTPKSRDYISSLRISPLFKFHEYGISAQTGEYEFFLPASEKGVSGSLENTTAVDTQKKIKVQMKSFDDVTKEFGHTHIDVLKMDIEGSEYEVLDHILDAPVTIDQVLVEFHDRLFDLKEPKSKDIVKKMNAKGFMIFGVATGYEEISFIRKELAG